MCIDGTSPTGVRLRIRTTSSGRPLLRSHRPSCASRSRFRAHFESRTGGAPVQSDIFSVSRGSGRPRIGMEIARFTAEVATDHSREEAGHDRSRHQGRRTVRKPHPGRRLGSRCGSRMRQATPCSARHLLLPELSVWHAPAAGSVRRVGAVEPSRFDRTRTPDEALLRLPSRRLPRRRISTVSG